MRDLRDPNEWRRAYQDLKALGRDYGAILIALTPFDLAYDLASLVAGRDLLSGHRLTDFETAAILVGFFTAGLGDDILGGGGRLLRSLDDADDAATRAGRGFSHLDEATALRLSRLDDFTGGDRALLRGDDLRRALAGFDDGGGALTRRLDAASRLRAKQAQAAKAWARAGYDLNDPDVVSLIKRGRGPVIGGSGAEGLSSRVKSGIFGRFIPASIPRKAGVARAAVKKHWLGYFGFKTPNLDALPDLQGTRALAPFKTGKEKSIFDVLSAKGYSPERARAELVWLQPKWWGGPNLLEGELAGMKILEEYGLPTPRNIGKTEYTEYIGPFTVEKVAVLQGRMVASSRDYLELYGEGKVEDLLESPLNERTLQDLHEIRQIISEQQINIPDLQFLVSREGRVVINDPQTPRKVAPGSDLGLTELNEFVKIVEEVIQLRVRR